MNKQLGIDLGTSHVAAAVMDGSQPRVVGNDRGGASFPATVALTDSGVRFGHAAQDQQHRVDGYLRLLGRKFHSPEVDWLRVGGVHPVTALPNGDAAIHVAGHDFSPTELVSFLLESLVRRVESEMRVSFRSCVIAVPSTFDSLQRHAVLAAARLADLPETTLVGSTAAAAAGYRVTAPVGPRRMAVLDFGAGSFEASLVSIGETSIDVLATAGDPMLGGNDFDRRMVLSWLDRIHEETGLDLSVVPDAITKLEKAAHATRHALSSHKKSPAISLPELAPGVSFNQPGMTRRALIELIADELAAVKEPCAWALNDAGLGTDDFEDVLVIGGVSRTPAILKSVKYLFRNEPHRPSNADYLVALGAAVVAAGRAGESPVVVHDVLSCSTGIKIQHGQFAPVLGRNRPLPARETRVFQTPDQDRVVFELFQGEHELATENSYLGRCTLPDVSAGKQFAVAFQMDESGLFSISQVNRRSGRDVPVKVAMSGGLTDVELMRLRRERHDRARPAAEPRHKVMQTAGDSSPSRKRSRNRPTGTLRSNRPGSSIGPYTHGGSDAMDVRADSLLGTTLEGRYEIEAMLGEGGMGRVYLANHRLLKKQFAIKVLHPELAAKRDIAERFVREAQAASSIDSDHVVRISDFGLLEDGTGYFVMEYLDGRTLEDELDRLRALPRAATIAIGIQIADGLRGAHERNIVHRDLKPANVLLIERSDRPHYCKILDFGIAKAPTSDSDGNSIITMVGVLMGTPHYMAPEQVDGINVDGRCDIYALGILMYEMVTGQLPFDAESVAEILAQQKWADPVAVHEVYSEADCPPELELVIRRCLEKDPADRYQTARDVADALAALDV